MHERGWLTTFIDMLMLLLTFFVFIIAISRFRFGEDSLAFAQQRDLGSETQEKPHRQIKGTAIELIQGLRTPRMPAAAQRILSEMAMAAQAGSYNGVDLFYNEEKISLLFPDALTFPPGSAMLQEQVREVLKDLVQRLSSTPFQVIIEGHTDSTVGETVDNVELSVMRAMAVAQFLFSRGLPLNRISVSGYGPYRPIADNENYDARRLNRRVEVHIMVNEEIL